MPSFGQEIRNVIAGEDFKIERSIYGIPEDVLIETAGFRVFDSETEFVEANAIITIDITKNLSNGGQITDDDSNDNGVGVLNFIIPKDALNATLTTGNTEQDNRITFTSVLKAKRANKIGIIFKDPDLENQAVQVKVSDLTVTVFLATNSNKVITSTAQEILTEIQASIEASKLVQVSLPGTGSGIVSAFAQTFLNGGNGGTDSLIPGTKYYYRIITKTTQDQSAQLIETGTLYVRSEIFANPLVAATTSARAAQTNSERVNKIIDQYLDVVLHDFRQLKVWDEHARRASNDPFLLRLTYKNLNHKFYPEVWTGQNEKLEANDFEMDYDAGTFKIISNKNLDNGHEDFFATYEFDLFPPRDLEILLNLTLQELNIAGAEGGGYITSYQTVDAAPQAWDAPLVYGTLVKAFHRLASDSGLWKNYLIWADTAQVQGPQIAKEAAAYYSEQVSEMKRSLKKLHLIASPSSAFDLFRQVGFGFFAVGGSKFRELRINRLSIH